MKEWTGKGFTIKATKKDKKSINIDDLQKDITAILEMKDKPFLDILN